MSRGRNRRPDKERLREQLRRQTQALRRQTQALRRQEDLVKAYDVAIHNCEALRELIALHNVQHIVDEPRPTSPRYEAVPEGSRSHPDGSPVTAHVLSPRSGSADTHLPYDPDRDRWGRLLTRSHRAIRQLRNDLEDDLLGQLETATFDWRQGRYKRRTQGARCRRNRCEGRDRWQRPDAPNCGWCAQPLTTGDDPDELEKAA